MVMKEVPVGTLRIKAHDIRVYEKTQSSWRLSSQKLSPTVEVIHLFDGYKEFDTLIDQKDPRFMKGMLLPNGKTAGDHINILPNGQVLEKAYSLFAPHLKIHDQDSHDHWDVLYKNAGGTFSYVYTLEKRATHRNQKYKKVDKFDEIHMKLLGTVKNALKNKSDMMALPMYTLLTTHMRIGNETYYKAHHHKGLTTLKKEDISIKGNNVMFNYIGKDGVPIEINKQFTSEYIARLKGALKDTKKEEFVFRNKVTGHPLSEPHFKKAFKRYCGEEFYPHIVRSHFATSQIKNFLQANKNPSKKVMKDFLFSVANELGHKRFSKKNQEWEDSYTVTLNSYVHPEYIQKVRKFL
ncbi:hypothetical protein COV12_02920 [Candidatus Woesearchaeota archaeon CG10_big_fil_rev_8_21_14_0_10_32_24]|nr:MAG: hypothetical protein COV12_02920 [Candidatus Woesearchaeota archaeon CG10_big_fil_rev_8_21_14_0_10_32_24]